MVSFQGTITAAATTTVAAGLVRTQLQTTIPSNSAWTLVESGQTSGIGAGSMDVYKCSAAGSGLSADFYAAIIQSAGTLYLGLAEGYNTSTHKPQRPAVNNSSGTLQTLQADGGVLPATQEIDWYNGSYNPGGGAISAVGNSCPLTVAVNDDYLITVAKDGLFIATRVSGQFMHVGAYDTLIPNASTNDPLPIALHSTSGGTSFATRMPMSGGQSRGYACNLNGRGSGNSTGALYVSAAPMDAAWTQMGAGLGGAAQDHYDLYSGVTGYQAFKLDVLNSYISNSATIGRDKNGWFRGYIRHARFIIGTPGFAVLDTCTVDGVAYTLVCVSGNNGLWIETNPV